MRRTQEGSGTPILYEAPSPLALYHRPIMWGLLVAALLVRAAYLKQLHDSPLWDSLPEDQLRYRDWGARIAEGNLEGSEPFDRGPLYAYLLGILFRLFGQELLIPRLLQILIGSVTCVLIYRIARHAFSPGAGLAAGVIAAMFGPFLFYDGMIGPEGLAAFLLAAVIFQLLEADGSQRGLLATAGLCLGLAWLARDTLILLAAPVVLWLLLDPWLRSEMTHGRTREGLARAGTFLFGILLVMAPVAARNIHVSGEVLLLTRAYWEGLYTPDLNLDRLSRQLLAFWSHKELPHSFGHDQHGETIEMLQLLAPAFGWIAPLTAAGLALSIPRWRDMLALWLIGGGYVASILLVVLQGQIRAPAAPLLVVFAGYGIVGFARSVSTRRFAWVLVALIAAGASWLASHQDLPIQTPLTASPPAPRSACAPRPCSCCASAPRGTTGPPPACAPGPPGHSPC